MKIQQTILVALLLCIQSITYAMSDCDCDWDIDLVCVQLDDGNIIPFPNACWANCMGYKASDFINCNYDISFDPTCGCDFEVAPVCVPSANAAEVILFPNSCLAECSGYAADDFLDCNYNLPTNPACGCDYEIDEVCVEVAKEVYMPFPNTCWAACMGYGPSTHVLCETVYDEGYEIQESIHEIYQLIMNDSLEFVETPEALNQQLSNPSEKVVNKIIAYPNPVNGGELNLKMDIIADADLRIDLSSITGKLFKSISHKAMKGKEVLGVEISDLPVGIYYLNVYSGSTTTSLKFVKQ